MEPILFGCLIIIASVIIVLAMFRVFFYKGIKEKIKELRDRETAIEAILEETKQSLVQYEFRLDMLEESATFSGVGHCHEDLLFYWDIDGYGDGDTHRGHTVMGNGYIVNQTLDKEDGVHISDFRISRDPTIS